jgi:hypothetical protein
MQREKCRARVPRAEIKRSVRTNSVFLSNVVHTFVYIPVSEHFSFAKIIHPPDRCGIKKLNKQHDHYTGAPCAGGTLKGHTKCYVLTHNTMPQMSQVLREHAIGMLNARMSTRAVAREWKVNFSTIS